MKKKLSAGLMLLAMLACEKQDLITKQDLETANLSAFEQEVLENDAILTFSSFKAFEDSASTLSKLSKSDLHRWELSKHFISLRRIYENINDFEIEQYDREEKLLQQMPHLKKDLKHTFSNLTTHLTSSIDNSVSEGVSYKIFDLSYAAVLNKNRLVKIDKALVQVTENALKVIENGDISEVEKLEALTEATQNQNLKYYPVKIMHSNFQEKNLRVAQEVNCQAYNGNGELRLRGFTSGTIAVFRNANTEWVHTMKMSIRMEFRRKNIFGGWGNHNSESYSANGTIYAGSYNKTDLYTPVPDPATSANPISFNLGQNFSGKGNTVGYIFYNQTYYSNVLENLDFINVAGTQNFQFVDINCSNSI